MILREVLEVLRLPRATINLMSEKLAGNDPFYAQVVDKFYREATSRHPKFRFVKRYEFGFCFCALPKDFDTYYMNIEAAARRNHKKALRMGYEMKRFEFNSRLDDVREILQSTPIRQGGLLPEEIREGRIGPVVDPPSRSSYHDYPAFGVFKEGKLFAYAACMVAGELCNLNDIYGHANFQGDGVVPLLIIEIVRMLRSAYPSVKYYSYGTYFGASESMRRFKRKFLFLPHHVTWTLGAK